MAATSGCLFSDHFPHLADRFDDCFPAGILREDDYAGIVFRAPDGWCLINRPARIEKEIPGPMQRRFAWLRMIASCRQRRSKRARTLHDRPDCAAGIPARSRRNRGRPIGYAGQTVGPWGTSFPVPWANELVRRRAFQDCGTGIPRSGQGLDRNARLHLGRTDGASLIVPGPPLQIVMACMAFRSWAHLRGADRKTGAGPRG